MITINTVAAVLCVGLASLIVLQCFSMSIKMTATAKPSMRVLVGLASFGTISIVAMTLGGEIAAYWYVVGGLAALAGLFALVLRHWHRGMPEKYDTDNAPLRTEL
jgi:hypothetical protein